MQRQPQDLSAKAATARFMATISGQIARAGTKGQNADGNETETDGMDLVTSTETVTATETWSKSGKKTKKRKAKQNRKHKTHGGQQEENHCRGKHGGDRGDRQGDK